MKKIMNSLLLVLFVSIGLGACKKDTTSNKALMTGKWTVNKIEVSGSATASENGTFSYTTSDYIDFKDSKDDLVEQSLNNQRTIGTYYVGLNGTFGMDFPLGSYYCTTNNITASTFQFTAKLDKTNIVKVYYLSR